MPHFIVLWRLVARVPLCLSAAVCLSHAPSWCAPYSQAPGCNNLLQYRLSAMPWFQSAYSSHDILTKPPRTRWNQPIDPLHQHKRYACFICHYKAEAGIEARYMRDMLHRMLRGGRVFLDSSELTDLRHLFELGVERSECLIVLATRGVFTRPVCLLEIWTAARANIPVIVVEIVGRSFAVSEAAELLNRLEHHLEAESSFHRAASPQPSERASQRHSYADASDDGRIRIDASSRRVILRRLEETHTSIAEFKATLKEALTGVMQLTGG